MPAGLIFYGCRTTTTATCSGWQSGLIAKHDYHRQQSMAITQIDVYGTQENA
jgi:hypothetical protein